MMSLNLLKESKIRRTKVLRVFFIVALTASLMGCGNETKSTSSTKVNEATNKTTKDEEQIVEAHESSDFKVTLLGTGSPILSMERFGNATLVEAGNEKLLFDAGRGAALRLSQMDIAPGEIDKLFMTHLHSDHTTGIPDIWLTGTLKGLPGNRETEFKVWGPIGTKEMMEGLENAYKADVHNRIDGGFVVPEGIKTIGHDIEPGIIYEESGIQVIAFLVKHDIEPAYGYRINYNGHSVVISGDTTYSENLIRFSKEADLIIHEVATAKPEVLEQNQGLQNVISKHTTPEQAGQVFNEVKPKLAVYSHIVLLGGLREEEANLLERTKEHYDGDVIVGEDLMTFEIGEEIIVKKPEVLENPDAITNE